MKIRAGIYKGRSLLENKFDHIRPTADMVKQAIFNKLAFSLQDAMVLDLFCGTGALGIEALSRGAKDAIFVDKDKRSVNLTRENLKKLGIKAKVLNLSYEVVLKTFKDIKFDIILLDPPYKSNLYEKAVQMIYESGLLSEDGVIVVEHDKKDDFDFAPFQIESEKIYGTKKVTYLVY